MTPQPTLIQWLAATIPLADYQLTPLAGDASFRRYFRLHNTQQSYIVMDAAAEKSSCIPFTAIANALRSKGLHTPDIIASDLSQGFLLLTDFGDNLYLKELNSANAKELYSRAIDALVLLQNCHTIPGWSLKPFTAEFMRQELNLFQEWFLEKYLSLTLPTQTQRMLSDCFDFLAITAAQQPQVFMHRDFHSANLMVLPKQQVGILDFQDAFMGPVTYDLVSLLRDCYVSWPEELVNELALQYWQKLSLPNVNAEMFLRWFDVMGMQRHLKALLTFSRKYCRDQNANYLQHIPRTLHYVLRVSERYPECHALNDFLTETVLEKCAE